MLDTVDQIRAQVRDRSHVDEQMHQKEESHSHRAASLFDFPEFVTLQDA